MTSQPDAGISERPANIPDSSLDELRSRLDGTLALADEPVYTEATAIWNGMIAKRPRAVVRPASVEDVVRTVGVAAHTGCELSIRGGGHNIAGLALCDGGITLDMSGFRDVHVDVEARTARVGSGCLLGDVDQATQAHGLAAPLGFVSLTGVAGLTLGGGFGYLTRRYGWTVDRLQEVEIVLADGTVRRASRTSEPELFWALRGGGGNFGVVTEFTFNLDPAGPKITGGLIAWSATHANEVLDAFRATAEAAPRELTMAVIRRNAPPAPWLPEDAHSKPLIMVVVCHSGSAEQAQSDLAQLRAVREPLADLIVEKDYVAQQALLDATQPKGMHYYWKSEFVAGLSDSLLETYNAQFVDQKAPANQIVLFHVAGALNDRPEDDGAVGNRDAAFACVVQSMGTADAPHDENRAWVRSAWEALRQFGTGGNYINFQTDDEPDARTEGSYRSNFDRLRAAKHQYDPANLFRVNRNIR
ncbi:MAG TPA: FAD-binding oxidoreductase [Candidatus Limnocylindria bacterium]